MGLAQLALIGRLRALRAEDGIKETGLRRLKAMVHLAGQPPGEATLVTDIAVANQIPKKFLDAILGTFLGTTPVVAAHVGAGAGYYVWNNWKFDLILTTITLALLLPLILRYLRPRWFRKIGVE